MTADVSLKAAGTKFRNHRPYAALNGRPFGDVPMNGLIYLVGLVVVIMAVLSLFGMR